MNKELIEWIKWETEMSIENNIHVVCEWCWIFSIGPKHIADDSLFSILISIEYIKISLIKIRNCVYVLFVCCLSLYCNFSIISMFWYFTLVEWWLQSLTTVTLVAHKWYSFSVSNLVWIQEDHLMVQFRSIFDGISYFCFFSHKDSFYNE